MYVNEQRLTDSYVYLMASAYRGPAVRTARKTHVGYKVVHKCMPARYAVVELRRTSFCDEWVGSVHNIVIPFKYETPLCLVFILFASFLLQHSVYPYFSLTRQK